MSDMGGKRRILAQIVGAQVAWWQLGFAVRAAVLRAAGAGRCFSDQETWDVAVEWARQQLGAPRWWRLIRDLGGMVVITISVVAVAIAFFQANGVVAVSGALASSVPLAAGWSWRQVRRARTVVRVAAGSDALPGIDRRRLFVQAGAVVVVCVLAVGTTVFAVVRERVVTFDCPAFAVDDQVMAFWADAGGRLMIGCPTGDSVTDASGVRYTPWSTPLSPSPRWRQDVLVVRERVARTMPRTVFTAWLAEGGPTGSLGEPTDGGILDGITFQNFVGGLITLSPDGSPIIYLGQTFDGATELSPCRWTDRPCITSIDARPGRIHVVWHYGPADAFNFRLWARDNSFVADMEVAGYEVTVSVPETPAVYLVQVQACVKHFLRRSTCTWGSTRVLARVE